MLKGAVAGPFTKSHDSVPREPARKIVCGGGRAPPCLEKINVVVFHFTVAASISRFGNATFQRTSILASGPDDGRRPAGCLRWYEHSVVALVRTLWLIY